MGRLIAFDVLRDKPAQRRAERCFGIRDQGLFDIAYLLGDAMLQKHWNNPTPDIRWVASSHMTQYYAQLQQVAGIKLDINIWGFSKKIRYVCHRGVGIAGRQVLSAVQGVVKLNVPTRRALVVQKILGSLLVCKRTR